MAAGWGIVSACRFQFMLDGTFLANLLGLPVAAPTGSIMIEVLPSEQRSARMAAVRQRDTKPERMVRSLLHRAGFRFRLTDRRLPGSPDIVLPRWRVAVFVNGCFWHGHDCHLYRLPATRTEFWRAKAIANVERDERVVRELHSGGWRTITVWQCALKGKTRLIPSELAAALVAAVNCNTPHVDLRGIRLKT